MLLTPDGYLPRTAEGEVEACLRATPAVLIEGPRGCGKTWLGRRFARSQAQLDDPDTRQVSEIDPRGVLEGTTPRLLDEWQSAPHIWNSMRHVCDERGRMGQFLLTGSARPADEETRHSGAGRVSRVRLRPMSLHESGDSTGRVSVGALLDGAGVGFAASGRGLDDIVTLACRGGWPPVIGAAPDAAQRYMRTYLAEIVRTDVPRLDGPRRHPVGVSRLLASLGRNAGTGISKRSLGRDIDPEHPMDGRTVGSYLDALQRLFVVDESPAWTPHLRSRTPQRRPVKRYLADPALMAAALEAGPARFAGDTRSLGMLFETLVVRDLRIYAEAGECRPISHYRDDSGLEVDAVLQRRDGAWIAVEVKLGGETLVESGAEALLKLRERIDDRRIGEPSRLVVVTAVGYAYDRPDGVSVVPITDLAP